MKKDYVSPEVEIVEFHAEDIVTTSLIDSGVAGDGNDDVTNWK